MSSEQNPIRLDFPDCIRDEFPYEYQAAFDATQLILDALPSSDFDALALHSPGLKGYDWTQYIRLGSIRLVRVGSLLKRAGLTSGRVLDFGSYFGNFSLFSRRLGFDVDAADTYSVYAPAFDLIQNILRGDGVCLIDLEYSRNSLGDVAAESYDAVLCMGVIEHIPHTPRLLLQMLNRLLKPGGTLIMDTPNLAYVYNRERLMAGQSIFPSIETQFFTEIPFEGHHREYTAAELRWMLNQIGHELNDIEFFNYSLYGLSEVSGRDAEFFRRMEADPEMRELIMTRSTKPHAAKSTIPE